MSNFGNAFMKALIESPLHFVLGSSMAVITVTGRKSGNPITTPINVSPDGEAFVVVSSRERTWWRNLRGGAEAQLRVAGKMYRVHGRVLEAQEEAQDGFKRYFQQNPGAVRLFGVSSGPNGQAAAVDLQRLAEERVLIRLERLVVINQLTHLR